MSDAPARPVVAFRVGARIEPWQRRAGEALAAIGLAPSAWISRPAGAAAASAAHLVDETAPGLDRRLVELGVELMIDLSLSPPPLDWPVREIWQPRFGHTARCAPPVGEELERGERGLLLRLVRIEEPLVGTVLEEGTVKLVGYDLERSRTRILETLARWPARVLAERRASGIRRDLGRIALAREVAREPARLGSWRLRATVRRLAECALDEHWRLGVAEAEAGEILAGFDARRIRWLSEHEGLWLADPVAAADGWVFAEAFDLRARRGFLVRTRLEPEEPVETVLALPHHLSWPFLVEYGGARYLLPEAAADGRLRLFRADPFPHRWVPDRVLIEDFAGVDPVLFRHAGRWWLFAGDRRDQDETRLYLFFAEDLFGPWRPHPMSPVKDDLGSARSAGPVFAHAGRLYRPAQDCSRTYGGAVVINRIERLDPEVFREVAVARLEPDPHGPCPHGLHTLLVLPGRIVVDGKRHRWSLRALITNLRASWREARASVRTAQPERSSA